MRLNEKTIDRTVIYNGSIIDLEVHRKETGHAKKYSKKWHRNF